MLTYNKQLNTGKFCSTYPLNVKTVKKKGTIMKTTITVENLLDNYKEKMNTKRFVFCSFEVTTKSGTTLFCREEITNINFIRCYFENLLKEEAKNIIIFGV